MFHNSLLFCGGFFFVVFFLAVFNLIYCCEFELCGWFQVNLLSTVLNYYSLPKLSIYSQRILYIIEQIVILLIRFLCFSNEIIVSCL